VARDRQRAKQRKARRAGQNPGPGPSEPHRANVPGELEHVSGDADEFDAAIVSGAGGTPLGDEPLDEDLGEDELAAEEPAVSEDDEPLDEEDAALEREAVAAGGRHGAVSTAATPGAPTSGGPNRLLAFLRASWAELQRVQWPDRRQVAQATAVVIGFVIVAGVYLGVADRVAQEIVDLII
jgi:preprotein translocase subunit SecE